MNMLFFEPLRPSALDRVLKEVGSTEYFAAFELLRTVVPEFGKTDEPWFLEGVCFPPYEEYRLGPIKPPKRRLGGQPRVPKPVREMGMPTNERNPNDELRISYWYGPDWDYRAFTNEQWHGALDKQRKVAA